MVIVEETEYLSDIETLLKMCDKDMLIEKMRILGREPEDIEAFFNTLYLND